MKKKTVFTQLLLAVFLLGCAQKNQTNLFVYKTLAVSLQNSTNEYYQQSFNTLKTLKNEAGTSQIASKWHSKAMLIQSKTAEIVNYILNLKLILKKGAGLSLDASGREVFREDDDKAVWTIFNDQGKGEELRAKVMQYNKDVLGIDSVFDSKFGMILNYRARLADNSKSFTEAYFENIPVVAGLAILEKFENNTRYLEAALVKYCYGQVSR